MRTENRPQMSQIVFRMAAPCGWLSANHRQHHMARARLVRAWRSAARWNARAEQLPRGLDRIHIELTFHQPAGRGRTRDVMNLAPTAKAVIDGLTDYGLTPDDSNRYVIGPDLRAGEPGKPGVTITITPIDEETPA